MQIKNLSLFRFQNKKIRKFRKKIIQYIRVFIIHLIRKIRMLFRKIRKNLINYNIPLGLRITRSNLKSVKYVNLQIWTRYSEFQGGLHISRFLITRLLQSGSELIYFAGEFCGCCKCVTIDLMVFTDFYESPLGSMTMASSGEKLLGLWFDGQKFDRYCLGNFDLERKNLPVFEETKRWLDIYFSGSEPEFLPLMEVSGSSFFMAVSDEMKKIPWGKTVSYGEIGKNVCIKTGRKVSAQAVGGAVGHNQFSILIPCHRVVSSNGKLTGYAGGIKRKEWLLNHEGAFYSL